LICQISIILAESGIEIIPKELRNNNSILSYLKRIGKSYNEVLLDKSFHYIAMRKEKIDSLWKRGRPDIVHICLMSILSTPLYLRSVVNVYIHTIDNKVIFVGKQVRIPKSFRRFEGLMIKLFQEKEIKGNLEDGNRDRYLLKIEQNMTFDYLINKIIQPDKVIGFSSTGILKNLKTIIRENLEIDNNKIVFVIGGFPQGEFSQNIRERFHMTYAITNEQLEAHVVVSRVIYECENCLSLLHGLTF
jgi:rRNA small subunit pseudouridine methyltransferase Nep1